MHVWNLYGDNNHHIAESCFKALARALRDAVEIDPRQTDGSAQHQGRALNASPMTVAIVDYGSGNLRSAEKAFERAAREAGADDRVLVTSSPRDVAAGRPHRPAGRRRLRRLPRRALWRARHGRGHEREVIERGKPFLGICVGMQLMATRGLEFGIHAGLDWIQGDVVRIEPGPMPGAISRSRTWAGTS